MQVAQGFMFVLCSAFMFLAMAMPGQAAVFDAHGSNRVTADHALKDSSGLFRIGVSRPAWMFFDDGREPPGVVRLAQVQTGSGAGAGSIVHLALPRVADYWVSLTLQSGGVLVFDGYVPDEATRSALGQVSGADISYLKLGSGAPKPFRAALDYALTLVSHLAEGRVAISGTSLSVSGLAESAEDYRAILSLLKADLPPGIVLGQRDLRAPRADDYVFSLARNTDGGVSLNGMVPDAELEAALLARIGSGPEVVTVLNYASAEPSGFAGAALKAVDFLAQLESGEIRFERGEWSVTGTPNSPASREAIELEFTAANLAQNGWVLKLADPVASVTPQSSESNGGEEQSFSIETPESVVSGGEEAAPAEIAQSVGAKTNQISEVAPSQGPAEETVVEAPAAPPPAASPNLDICRVRLAELSEHNAILFQSGSATIAAGASSELDAFAQALLLCPDAAIEVEGHTDSDGDDQQNLILSVARAEAVVGALVERGVAPERLYAIGYGESRPVADNATSDGKRRNRRIVVLLRAEAE